MSDKAFYESLSEILREICRLTIEQKLETDELIRLLTPLLDLITEKAGKVRSFRNKFLKDLTESFSSLPLTFSLQEINEKYAFVVEPKTIRLSIQGSIMYQTNAPTDCRTFLENFVRLYPVVTTPVIQFWILSMGIFEDIFSTFGDVLKKFYFPPKVPNGHCHPFRFIENYWEYYKFDLFDKIFRILNRSVPGLMITSKDFHQILSLLKEVQNIHSQDIFEQYPREQWIAFVFISALIGFQLRDMLSSAEDKKMVTDVLMIKEIEMLQLHVKAEVKDNTMVSINFFQNREKNTEVDLMYIKKLITNENLSELIYEYDALQKFYKDLI